MIKAKTILIVVLFLFSSACQKQQERLIKKQYFIFGTIIEVLVWHNDNKVVNQALSEVETELNGMHSQWHAWKPGRLHDINKTLRAGNFFELTDEEAEFIQTTIDLSKQSLGNFNPAIGELINLWGFHSDDYPILEPPPNDIVIQKYLKDMPRMSDITITDNIISSTNQHIWLDYGGVAKGYAIDKAINILKGYGIENAIVNAGGDLRSIGNKGDKSWKVAIRKPHSEDVLAVISVQGDESIFTSGNYERYKEFDDKRYAHIINPKTGYGIDEISSITIIAENGTKADAAATALIVSGLINISTIAQSMKLSHVLLITEAGDCLATKAIILRLQNLDQVCELLLLR